MRTSTKSANSYQRLVYRNVPIYINPGKPDWFIPTTRADLILRNLNSRKSVSTVALKYTQHFGGELDHALRKVNDLLSRIDNTSDTVYRGRGHHRHLENLKECWFHITNQCDMACGHCMFASDGKVQPSLVYDDLLGAIDEVSCLGCRLFYFTGGEPFVYEKFTRVCDRTLEKADSHIVILTNGKTLKNFDSWLKRIPKERVHFQMSIDGLRPNHDALRGKGAFRRLIGSLEYLQTLGCPVSLAMAVNRMNVHEMPSILDIAHKFGVRNIHYLWLFSKGRASSKLFVPPKTIFKELIRAYEKGQSQGVSIDNIEIFKSQVFSLPGTRFDLSNAAWESLAIGPDGTVYPSPALIGEEELAAGNISEGLENVWRNSPVLDRIREASLIDHKQIHNNPLKYLIGGGDIDHSYIAQKALVGADPYIELYHLIILYLLSQEAKGYGQNDSAGMVCRMGERLYECDEDSTSVGFTHSNCVLSLPHKDSHYLVKSFYSRAAESVHEDIVNPVYYGEEEVSHIPAESRVRSYGCGSPVLDCDLKRDEVLVDLGCGAGVECFIAAKRVGPEGRVYGIDMADAMLDIAINSLKNVAKNLGYINVEFRKGFLEEIPAPSGTVDVVISNCVVNLSPDKRRTFKEILRVLKPGGRLCISDIVCEEHIPLDIRYNEKLRGECIGGAMRDSELFSMLEDLTFEGILVMKRFLYRRVRGYNFYSTTYTAYKPQHTISQDLIYRGPFASVITEDGQVIQRGRRGQFTVPSTIRLDESFFLLDESGHVGNIEQVCTCSCSFPVPKEEAEPAKLESKKYASGCMVCGSQIEYFPRDREEVCHYCRKTFRANAICVNGHYVCDQCHSRDALEVIREICVRATHSDMIKLLSVIRSHPAIPIHGPEHHSLIPGIILSVCKNLWGNVSDEEILDGIERGSTIVGGACSFLGICGAATGVGIAFSVIVGATPYKAKERQLVQRITGYVLERISGYEAARCCQRDSWIALKAASELSKRYLPIILPANEELVCTQYRFNKECIRKQCPLWSKVGMKYSRRISK
jgi:MoaA/NifB/PqqE/SkfB family radical SAM enzyme/ubiquinone/menaquinone biosynthesis C-methylase UbiE